MFCRNKVAIQHHKFLSYSINQYVLFEFDIKFGRENIDFLSGVDSIGRPSSLFPRFAT